MREQKIDEIVKKAEELSLTADNFLNSLRRFEDAKGASFNVDKIIRGTDSTVSQISARMHAVAGIITEFQKATRADLVPISILDNLFNSINSVISATNKFIKRIADLQKNQGGLQNFDYSNFHAQTNNGNSHNLEGDFHLLNNSVEELLQRFFEGLYILKPRASYSFQAAANGLASIISDADNRLSKIKVKLKEIQNSVDTIGKQEGNASAQIDEINRLKGEIDSDRKTISEYLAKVTQERASVETIASEAAVLHQSVNNYQSDFDKFQKQLDSREKDIADGSKKLNDLLGSFQDNKTKIIELIDQSEKMLSSATVAGLASNFATMKDNLTNELWWARFAFYISIIFLTISALPLFIIIIAPLLAPILNHLFPDIIYSVDNFAINTPDYGWKYIGQVVSRIVILVPAAWLVSFTAIRHSSLFRLREHYAYKYSMAVAVEGFKQQAPDYKQEIAALVLEQLAFNPADKIIPSKDIREGKAPGISGFLLEKIRSKVDQSGSSSETKQTG